MVIVMVIGADTPDMMVVPGLRHSDIALIADDLRSVFAELTIHRGLAFAELGDPLAERVEHRVMVA